MKKSHSDIQFQSNPINPKTGNSVHEYTDYLEKPRYLGAISENNSPRFDWGPKKKANHYGRYAHLNDLLGDGNVTVNGMKNAAYEDVFDESPDSTVLNQTKF